SAYVSQNAANRYAQAPQVPSRNFWTRGWENFSIFDLIPGVGCSASLGVNESNADAGLSPDATPRSDAALTDARNRDVVSDTGDTGFQSVCDTYAPFTPLAPVRPNTPLNNIVLGGPNGEFVCYQEWNWVPARDPIPGYGSPYVDGYAILNRVTGAITRLNVIHREDAYARNCSFSDDGRYVVVLESPHAAGPEQIVLYDLQDPASPRRITVTAGNDSSVAGVISSDGTRLYFVSHATDLTSEPNPHGGIFQYDVRTGRLNRLPLPNVYFNSVEYGIDLNRPALSLSADGRRLAFVAMSSVTSAIPQIYLADLETYHISQISSASNYSALPFTSGTGHRVLFTSSSGGGVFLWEEGSGLRLVSTAPDGSPLRYGNIGSGISRDGTRVAMSAQDSRVVPGAWPTLPGRQDAFTELVVLNLSTGRRNLVYQNLCLGIRFGMGAISADGHFGIGSFAGFYDRGDANSFYMYPLLGFSVDHFLNP
ncbi:MAG: hypothetical protein HQM15_09235, partial [Deltaproteobacteria bacterium]|nr:hypothetical protein [Deltaproteobacteria bacterium]